MDIGEWTNRLDDYAKQMVLSGERRPAPGHQVEDILMDTEPYMNATDLLTDHDMTRLQESFYRSYDRYRRLALEGRLRRSGGFRKRSQTARFNRCVKAVKKTIVPRPDSSKESAAIAICTKSVLQTRGRTMKRYRKGRLRTQKLKR